MRCLPVSARPLTHHIRHGQILGSVVIEMGSPGLIAEPYPNRTIFGKRNAFSIWGYGISLVTGIFDWRSEGFLVFGRESDSSNHYRNSVKQKWVLFGLGSGADLA